MTAPLLSEEQIRDLVYSVCGDNSLSESATRKAIRQAVKLAGEEAAKVCDAKAAEESTEGCRNATDVWCHAPKQMANDCAATIRARL